MLPGISQRDISQSYSCIGADQTNIRSDVVSFWKENIENRFPLPNCELDFHVFNTELFGYHITNITICTVGQKNDRHYAYVNFKGV